MTKLDNGKVKPESEQKQINSFVFHMNTITRRKQKKTKN